MSARGRAAAGLVLGVGGGLALAGSAVAEWVSVPADRAVGEVRVPDEDPVTGAEVAAGLLPLGLVVGLAALALGPARGWGRRVVGALLLAGALAAGVHGGLGLAAAPDGDLGAGVGALGLGVALTGAAGALALRPDPPPDLPARYDLDADDASDEWRLASGEAPGEGDQPDDDDPSAP